MKTWAVFRKMRSRALQQERTKWFSWVLKNLVEKFKQQFPWYYIYSAVNDELEGCHAHATPLGPDWKYKLQSQNSKSLFLCLSVPDDTCPSLETGTRSTSRDDPPMAILDPVLTHCEWTFIVTHQEQITSRLVYNLLSTIYVVAWWWSYQLDSSST